MNIVVTGASKGIGLAIIDRFARDHDTSHSFALCARNEAELQQARTTLTAQYPAHRFFAEVCDVAEETDVERFAASCLDRLGTPDVVVNNAGFGIFKSITDLSPAEFRSVIDTNFRGVYLLSRALLPAMRAARKGTILTISSLAGKNGFAGGSAYCASKFAVRGFMQNLFLDVRSDNIRCVTICPGSVDTEFFAEISNPSSTTRMLAASDIAESVWFASHLPPSATVSEIEIRPTNPKG
jgi:3-oxoacyl-[acyl-carrier protein] reductase